MIKQSNLLLVLLSGFWQQYLESVVSERNQTHLMADTNIGFYIKICKFSVVVFILLEYLLFYFVGYNFLDELNYFIDDGRKPVSFVEDRSDLAIKETVGQRKALKLGYDSHQIIINVGINRDCLPEDNIPALNHTLSKPMLKI